MIATTVHPAGGLVLHGYPVSNYFNIARAALVETGVSHSIVACRASQEEGFLSRSPMGKIPFLETPDGDLAETIAIVGYIDAVSRGVRLYPADAFGHARTTQLINITQAYIETPARSLYPAVFMGGEADASMAAAARATIERALDGLSRAGSFGPFLLGETLTAADLFLFFCLDMADRAMRFTQGWSPVMTRSDLKAWYAVMAQRASIQAGILAFEDALCGYLAEKGGAYDPATTETTYALLQRV